MAEIVKIKDRMSHRPSRMAPKGANAVLLLFTGVRYQKVAEPVSAIEKALMSGLPAPLDVAGSLHSGLEPSI